MDFEITFENGSYPLLCVVESPSDVLRCLLETSRRLTSIDLEGDELENMMQRLPRLKSDLPIVKGKGFDVVRLDEPQEMPAVPIEPPKQAAPEPEPEPKPEPVPEPEPTTEPEPQAKPRPPLFPKPQIEPKPERAVAFGQPDAPEEVEEEPGYKGFLHLKCPKCGNVFTFCSRTHLTEMHCRECGTIYPLENLTRCRTCCKCGKGSRYMTNVTDWFIEINCVQCGQPQSLEYNPKKAMYVPI